MINKNMKVFILNLIVIIFFSSCATNKYYLDLDFNTMSGVKEIDKDRRDTYLEVIPSSEKLVVVGYLDIMSLASDRKYDTEGNCTNCRGNYENFKDVFIKKDGYYYKFEEIKESDPSIKIIEHTYINKGKIVIYDHVSEKENKQTIVKIIDTNKKNITELYFENEFIKESEKISIEQLRNKINCSMIITYDFSILKELHLLKIEYAEVRNDEHTQKKQLFYYKAFPNDDVNIFWNLYKYQYGEEVRR